MLFRSTNKTVTAYFGGGGYLSGTIPLNVNSWNHICATRSGSTATLYINGTKDVTNSSFSPTNTGSQGYYIGRDTDTQPKGYISNFRIVNGSAVYSPSAVSITVPTSPLTAITNTALLTCQANRFIDSSSNNFAVTVGGTPQVSRFSPFAPTVSTPYSTKIGRAHV